MESSTSPIIVTGRGGSGTRLISDLAQRNNIFLGNELNESEDSLEWKDLIYELVVKKFNSIEEAASATKSTNHGISNGEKCLSDLIDVAVDVLSKKNWNVGQKWGWKLPETMLLVPELMSIFPDAKLIHLVRHPVTSSLRRSHKTSRPTSSVGRSVLKLAYSYVGLDQSSISTDDDYRRNAITWMYQVDSVSKYAKEYLDDTRYLEVHFEDICNNPEIVQKTLCDFVGIKELNRQVQDINSDRLGTIDPQDPRVEEVWKICGETAKNLGYLSMERAA